MVPTWRRPAALARALTGLAAQVGLRLDWEVVIVESGSTGRPGSPGQASLGASGVRVRRVADAGTGAARARNLGIEHAAGEIIAFLDDDVVPEPDWLALLLEPILAQEADGAGGRVVLDPTVPRPAWFNPGWMAGYLAEVDPGGEEHQLEVDEWLVSATAAFRAELLRAVGGFDVALGPRAGTPLVNDDIDLSRRLLARGARLRYRPGATVVHELPASRLTRRYLMRRLWTQGRSDWLMDRGQLGTEAWAGLDRAWYQLLDDLRLRRGEGIWRPPVALRAAGELCRYGGMSAEGLRHLSRRGLSRPGAGGG